MKSQSKCALTNSIAWVFTDCSGAVLHKLEGRGGELRGINFNSRFQLLRAGDRQCSEKDCSEAFWEDKDLPGHTKS